MTCEDPRQTFELFKALFGEAIVLQTQGFSVDKQHGGGSYNDNLSASAQRVARIDFRDLQKQVEGQFHLAFKGELVRGKTFYAAPPLAGHQFVRLNYQLRLEDPDRKKISSAIGELKALSDRLTAIGKALIAGEKLAVPQTSHPSLRKILALLDKYGRDPSTQRPGVIIKLLATCQEPLKEPAATPLHSAAPLPQEPDENADEGQEPDELDAHEAAYYEAESDVDMEAAPAPAAYPRVLLGADLKEINLGAGLGEDEAARSALESENCVNKALRRCYAPPLPSHKDAGFVDIGLRTLLAGLEVARKPDSAAESDG
jgi:intracellular multiplication protein IcmO